jgi:hypothetical protein
MERVHRVKASSILCVRGEPEKISMRRRRREWRKTRDFLKSIHNIEKATNSMGNFFLLPTRKEP